MTINFKHIYFFLIGLCLVTSCFSRMPMSTDSSVSTPKPTKSIITTTLLPSVATNPNDVQVTAISGVTPEFVSLFDNPEKIPVDERLKLSIKETNQKCYKSGSLIPITVVYENLTDYTFFIVNYNIIDTHVLFNSKGQLFPFLYTFQGEQVITPYDIAWVDSFNPNSPLLQQVSANSKLDVFLEFYFPKEQIVINENGSRGVKDIMPGYYLLQLVYSSHQQENAWEGTISSNQILICIEN